MSSEVSDRDLLSAVGEAVWGARWRRPMASAMGVSHVTLGTVAAGRRPLTPEMRRRLGRWAGAAWVEERAEAQRRLALLAQARDRWDPLDG